MGGSTSKIQKLKIDRNRWSKMQSHQNYDIMWDKEGQQAQLYKFILDETMDIDNQIDVNNYRAKHQGTHVRVLGAQESQTKVGLCGKQKNVQVLTQRIPTLIADSRQLNFQQSNIVLYNALKGYSRLHDKFGAIDVTDKMIGFNHQGNTRVWINENFGRNHPVTSKDHNNSNLTGIKGNSQQKMLQNIINIIERKCEKGQFPQPYKSDVYKLTSFSEVLNFIESTNIVPLTLLDANRVVLDKYLDQVNNIQQRVVIPPQPSSTTTKSVVNTRVSFNYISPTVNS